MAGDSKIAASKKKKKLVSFLETYLKDAYYVFAHGLHTGELED
jgi:hypothetical protein